MKKTAKLFPKIILISLLFLNGGNIFGMVPVPIVKNVSYCGGETPGQIDESTVDINPEAGYLKSDFQLRWYGAGMAPSNTFSFTAPTPTTTSAGTTTYWVSQLNKLTQEESSIISFDVIVDEPLYAQLEDKNICEGESVKLDASPYQATTYIWTSSSDTVLTPRFGAIQTERPEITTTYYVAMERGKCTASDEITVTVNTLPRISRIDSLDVKTHEIITLEGFGTHPFSYAVDDQPFDFNPIKYDLFGMHTFYVIDFYGCRSQAYGYVISSNSSVPASVIKIYPNPFTDKLEIEKAANYNLTVTDMQGRIQYQRANLTDNEMILTSGWAEGIYLIALSSQDNNIVKKVIKY